MPQDIMSTCGLKSLTSKAAHDSISWFILFGVHISHHLLFASLSIDPSDVFAAFEETGDVFDADTAERCRKCIYSTGNTVAPDELFRKFRGRDPDVTFMLKNRGLIPK